MQLKARGRRKPNRAAGFTILELMVASAVFAVILLVVAIGVVSFTNSYYKGINSSTTQTNARTVMAQLAQAIQFGQTVQTGLTGSGGVQGICIDNTLYSYLIGQEVMDTLPFGAHQGYHGLVVTSGVDCSSAIPSLPATGTVLPTQRELLNRHVRLSALSVTSVGSLYTIHLRLIFGDDDLLTNQPLGAGTNWANELCSGGAGDQFCAVSDLTTTVQQRLL